MKLYCRHTCLMVFHPAFSKCICSKTLAAVNIPGAGSLDYTLETTTVQQTKKVKHADVRGRKTEGWLTELENNSYGSTIKKAGRGKAQRWKEWIRKWQWSVQNNMVVGNHFQTQPIFIFQHTDPAMFFCCLLSSSPHPFNPLIYPLCFSWFSVSGFGKPGLEAKD